MLAGACLLLVGAVPAHAEVGSGEWPQFQGGPGHPGTAPSAPEPPYRQAWRFQAPEGSLSGAVTAGGVAITVGEHAVFGIDLATGNLRWTLLRNGGQVSMPAVGEAGGKTVLVFTDVAPGGDARLVGVDLHTRSELWRRPLKAISRSGVTIDGSTAFVGDDYGNLYAFDLVA